jgi:hypothetical protein
MEQWLLLYVIKKDIIMLLTKEEWELLSPESRCKINAFINQVEQVIRDAYGESNKALAELVLLELGYTVFQAYDNETEL